MKHDDKPLYWLPTPTPRLQDFMREWVKKEHGLDLSDIEVADISTRVLHIYFIKEYCYNYVTDLTIEPKPPGPKRRRRRKKRKLNPR